MPKKKKKSGRGKAKKAAENSKTKEKQQGSLDAQMEQLNINDESRTDLDLLKEAIKLAEGEKQSLKARAQELSKRVMKTCGYVIINAKFGSCGHGYLPGEDIAIEDFADTFVDRFRLGYVEWAHNCWTL